jgi:hypothetical protein
VLELPRLRDIFYFPLVLLRLSVVKTKCCIKRDRPSL